VPSPAGKLAKILVAEPGEALQLLEAQWALLCARLARRHEPLGQLVSESVQEQPIDPCWQIPAMRLSTAVDRVSRFGCFRPTCLEQAMALQRMLERRGIGPGVIRVGVQMQEGSFIAHAWLQLGDMVLGDQPGRVKRFHQLTDVKAVRL